MSTSTDTATRVVNIINFHGLTLWVIENGGTEYIQAKPLADLAGIDWRSAKKTLFADDNAVLYGTKALNHPVFAAEGGTSTPPSQGVYIRLDRSRMYLARINTAMMRGKGAIEAAERLLALQIEWAEALHRYETHGVAYKRAEKEDRTQLVALLKARQSPPTPGERKAITKMIHDTCEELGYPVEEPQGELNV